MATIILSPTNEKVMKQKQKQLLTELMNADAKDGLYEPNKMISAVEWLKQQWVKRLGNLWDEDFEQAKQMEKKQIMKAVYDSMGTNFDPNMGRAELYYNEHYGK